MEFQYCHQNLFIRWHHQKFLHVFESVSSNKLSLIYMSSVFICSLKELFSSNMLSTKSIRSFFFFFFCLFNCSMVYRIEFLFWDQRTHCPLSLFLFLLFQHPELEVQLRDVQFFCLRGLNKSSRSLRKITFFLNLKVTLIIFFFSFSVQ